MNKKIAVAFVTDDIYAPYTSNAIFSLNVNSNKQDEYKIYIFYSHLTQKNINLLAKLKTKNCSINFVNLEQSVMPYVDLFYTRAHYSIESYYRFFIPHYLGKSFEYFIYLDDDLIINCDLSEIYAEIDNSKTINGVINFSTQTTAKRIQSLNLSKMNYINAGVLVINCKRFEVLGYFQKAIDCLIHNRDLTCIDQDVLNLICVGDIGVINPEWNIQWHNLNKPNNFDFEIEKVISSIKNPRIIHYTSDKKPWNCMLNSYSYFFLKYSSANPIYRLFYE